MLFTRRHPFTAWTRLTWSLGSFTFLIEFAYLWTSSWYFKIIRAFYKILLIDYRTSARGSLAIAAVMTTLSRLIRYLQYGLFYPRKMLYLAPFLLYLYLHQLVKIYALLTLENVSC